MKKPIGYIATADIFQVKIIADNIDKAMDILMEETKEFPIIRIQDKPIDRIFIRLGEPGQLMPDKDNYHGVEILFTKLYNTGTII
jgi:hypothetical protein